MSQIVKLKELKAQIKQHAKAAYELLPETLVLPSEHSGLNRSIIEHMYQRESWTYVINLISSFGRENDYSPALLRELSAAREATKLHDAIAANEIMARTSELDKRIIGEAIRASGPFVDCEGEREEVHADAFHLNRLLTRTGESWPDIEDASLASLIALWALSFILSYPHDKDHEWSKYFSVPREQAEEVAENWFSLRNQILNLAALA